MRRTRLILVTTLVLSGLVPALITQAARPQQAGELDELWFGTFVSPPLVDWFNQMARVDDLASVKAGGVEMLGQITAGQKQVVFASVAEAEQLVPTLADQIDIIGYDLEHWPATPDEEQADPVAAAQRMRELAQRYDLEVTLGPDRRFAVDYGAEMAPYADRFILQLQRLQDDTEKTLDFAQPLIQELRQANTDLQISVVFRPDANNVEQLLALVNLLKEDIDGVSILSTPAAVESVQAFVNGLRSAEASASTVPTVAATPTTPPTPLASPTPAPLPTPTPLPTQCTWPTGIVLTGSGLTAILMRRRRRAGT